MITLYHGEWERYTPNRLPRGVTPNHNVMFCRRVGDNVDWYDFINIMLFRKKSIKVTVMDGEVKAANRDPSKLFPQYCSVYEIIGEKFHVDPQKKYGGKKIV